MRRYNLIDMIGRDKRCMVILVIFAIIAILVPLSNNSYFNSRRKKCSDETKAYVESVEVREERKRSGRYGRSSRYNSYDIEYYNVMELKFEYKGEDYFVTTSFRTDSPIQGGGRYTTIYVDPSNPRHVLTEDEHQSVKQSMIVYKLILAVVFLISIILLLAKVTGFSDKKVARRY